VLDTSNEAVHKLYGKDLRQGVREISEHAEILTERLAEIAVAKDRLESEICLER
jgi:hypothetical protein